MTIAFDAESNSSASNATFSWTHTPVGTPAGVAVEVIGTNTLTDSVTGVTYGGVAMTQVAGSPSTHSAGVDDSVIHGYVLGEGVPPGAQTVEVTLSPGATTHYAAAISVTGAFDIEVDAVAAANTGAGTANAVDVNVATTGATLTVLFGAFHSGEAAVSSISTDNTEIAEVDFGQQTGAFARRTGSGDTVTMGWNMSTDTGHAFVMALKETPGSNLHFSVGSILARLSPFPTTFPAAFARREVTNTTSWMSGDGQHSNAATVMFRWRNYETSEGVYASSIEDGLIASLEDACTDGYQVVLRVFCGADAPVGRPSDGTVPDWMLSGGHPVEVITTKANDGGGGLTEGDLISVPLGWDTNFRYHYQRLLERIATITDANDVAGHPRHTHILFVPASMPTELGTEMTLGYGNVDSPFNQAAWNSVSTATQRRDWYEQAWKDCLDDHMNLLPNIKRGLAGGHLFNDGHDGADAIIQAKGGPQVVCMTTDLRPNYATWGPNQHDYLLKGKAAGCYMGIQTAGESAAPQGQSFVDAAEFALSTYGIHFHETYTSAYTSTTLRTLAARGGWPGGTVTTAQYLADHASDLQSRMA